MKQSKNNRLNKEHVIECFLRSDRTLRIILAISFVVLTLFVMALVYVTGGIKYVYSHGMYLPIVLGAMYFGVKGGLLYGLLGGLLLGPFMPIDVTAGTMQEPINWIYRIFFFGLIGAVVGYTSTSLKSYFITQIEFYSVDPETKFPLITQLVGKDKQHSSRQAINNTILVQMRITNQNDLIDLLGNETYIELLLAVGKKIKKTIEPDGIFYQKDRHGLLAFLKPENSETVIESLRKTLQEPSLVNSIPVYLYIAFGVAPVKESLREGIYRSTFASRYAERRSLDIAYFKDNHKPNTNDLLIMGNFQKALYDNEFTLVYQPQINLNTKEIVGVEVLVRWKSSVLGDIEPSHFVPLIEQTHLINELSNWVIKTAFEAQHILMQNNQYVKMAINLSVKNLFAHNFFTNLKNWMESYGVPTKLIEFEITEPGLMVDSVRVHKAIKRLAKENIALSIDDFGTGYSSLSHLKKFPIKAIKLDEYFIHNMEKDKNVKTMTSAALKLAKNLDIMSIAECVETEAQLNMLKAMKCDIVQGFYLAKPMSLKQLRTWLIDYQKNAS